MSTETRRIDLILELLRKTPARGACAFEGVEALDDCAIVRVCDGVDVVIGSDFVRGEGFYLFKLGLLSWYDIGYYLVGANVSDVAAMGARPVGVVTVCRYSAEMSDDDFRAVMSGVVDACQKFDAPLLGGDTGGYEKSVLSAAAFGICSDGRVLRRNGARPGDTLFLSGDIGLAGAALAYFLRAKPEGLRLPPTEEAKLLERWQKVAPAVNQGVLLTEFALSSCAIDTSDGFKASCRQLAESSKVDIEIDAMAVPIDPIVSAISSHLSVDPFAMAVGDSVDFRLLFSTSKSNAARTVGLFQERGWPIHEVGTVTGLSEQPKVRCRIEDQLIEMPGVEWSQSDLPSIDILRDVSRL
jgi:thiamine-monophosphate kinase